MLKKMPAVFLLSAILLPVMIFISCSTGEESGPQWQGISGANAWSIAVMPFIIGEVSGSTLSNNDAVHMKVMWPVRSDSSRYEVYRDGTMIAQTTGDRWDDYDLVSGQAYVYSVKAYFRNTLQATSRDFTVTAFTPADRPLRIYENGAMYRNGAYETLADRWVVDNRPPTPPDTPSGYNFGGKYYDFRVNIAGSGADSVARLQGRVSDTGLGGTWSDWTILTTDGVTPAQVGTYIDPETGEPHERTGIKLESNSIRRLGNKVVYSAHREEAGSTYNLGHLFLASFYPGETYPQYAGWPGGAAGEVTFDAKPMGLDSRDMSIYIDDVDGKIYALCSGIGDITVHLLDNEMRGPTGTYLTVLAGQNRETPHFVRIGTTYYLFTSWQNGWYPTQTKYIAIEGSLTGPFTPPYDVGGQGSYGSQYNRTERFAGTQRDSYGMWGYRWANNWSTFSRETAANNGGNRQRLAPVVFNGNFVGSAFFSHVAQYEDYGLIGVQAGRYVSLGKPVTVGAVPPNPAAPPMDDYTKITNGRENADSGFFRSLFFPYELVVDFESPAVIKEINLTHHLVKGSDIAYRYRYYGSNDQQTWTELYDGYNNVRPGFLVDYITDSAAYRYVKIEVFEPRNAAQTGADAGWSEGIISLAVYGTPQ